MCVSVWKTKKEKKSSGSQKSLIKKNLFKVCEELWKQLTPPVFLLFGTDFAKTNEMSLHPPRNKTLSPICSCMKTVICVAAVQLSVFFFFVAPITFFFCNKNNRMSLWNCAVRYLSFVFFSILFSICTNVILKTLQSSNSDAEQMRCSCYKCCITDVFPLLWDKSKQQ